ncbi:hypothetical protein V1294_006962 [Bradyrhizobium sp. AZCC 1678]|uniref:hypothetical protein n=1 Tax=Bradyrhizobium sp. AZCC 1678 TaxID=3117030 RepID=UPI002FF38B75
MRVYLAIANVGGAVLAALFWLISALVRVPDLPHRSETIEVECDCCGLRCGQCFGSGGYSILPVNGIATLDDTSSGATRNAWGFT